MDNYLLIIIMDRHLMIESEIIDQAKQLLGENEAKYLKNKLSGGKSNEKGSRYESNFAVFKLSESIHEILDNQASQQILFGSQVPNFVDDFVIHNTTLNQKQSFQLKNSSNISWTTGKHPIAIDFHFHFRLDEKNGITNPQTILTLSCEDTFNSLNNEIPENIRTHTHCVLFKDIDNINTALLEQHELREALSNISISDEIDKLTHLHTVVKGVWENYKGTYCDVHDFLDEVRAIKPEFLRSFNKQIMLDSRAVEILNNITGFSYQTLDNKLTYVYSSDKGRLEGFVGIDGEDALSSFNQVILESNPTNFMELYSLGILE